jgi:hypothetical protein
MLGGQVDKIKTQKQSMYKKCLYMSSLDQVISSTSNHIFHVIKRIDQNKKKCVDQKKLLIF